MDTSTEPTAAVPARARILLAVALVVLAAGVAALVLRPQSAAPDIDPIADSSAGAPSPTPTPSPSVAVESTDVSALMDEAFALVEAGDQAGAAAAFERVILELRGATRPADLETLLWALFNRGVSLTDVGEIAEAQASYQEAIDTLPSDPLTSQVVPVSWSLINLSILAAEEGDLDRADDLVHALAALTGDSRRSDFILDLAVRRAWIGGVLVEAGRPEAALVHLDALRASEPERPTTELREALIRGRSARAEAHAALGRDEEALAEWASLAAIEDLATDAIATAVADASIAAATHQFDHGHHDEAVALAQVAINRFGDSTVRDLVRAVAEAHRLQIASAWELEDADLLLEVTTAAIDGLENTAFPRDVEHVVAYAQIGRISSHQFLGDFTAAEEAGVQVIAAYDDRTDALGVDTAARATLLLAWMAADLGDVDEAFRLALDVMERVDGRSEPMLQSLGEMASSFLADLTDQYGEGGIYVVPSTSA